MASSKKSSKQKIVAIIQARLTSTRLPRKVLKKLGRKTILQHTIDRVWSASLIDEVVVASPHKIPFKNAESFIGCEKNVLERYYWAARAHKADIIVRITSDCPLIDPNIIDYAIDYFNRNGFPYITFAPVDGLDVEVFNFKMLEKARNEAESQEDREHVTPYMKRYTKVSVDTEQDLERVRKIYGMGKQNYFGCGWNGVIWNGIS